MARPSSAGSNLAHDPLHAQLPAGQVCRLLTSATGLAWAAHVPAAQSDRMIEAELDARMEGAPANRKQADALLAEARAHGMARVTGSSNFTRRYGTRINAVAAPVFDAEGRMVLSLTVVGAADTTDVDWDSPLCHRLRAAAAQLSQRLALPTTAAVDLLNAAQPHPGPTGTK